jgi:hypothetical protein
MYHFKFYDAQNELKSIKTVILPGDVGSIYEKSLRVFFKFYDAQNELKSIKTVILPGDVGSIYEKSLRVF